MSNNLMKTILVGFIVFFNALFIGNADVKADTCAQNLKDENNMDIFTVHDTCYGNASKMDSGYAYCKYFFEVKTGTDTKTTNSGGVGGGGYTSSSKKYDIMRHVDIQLQITKNTHSASVNSYYGASIATNCTDPYSMYNITVLGHKKPETSKNKCKTSLVGGIEMGNAFFKKFDNNGWKCPDTIQITSEKLVNGDIAANFKIDSSLNGDITAYKWFDGSVNNDTTVDYDTGDNVIAGTGFETSSPSDIASIVNWGELGDSGTSSYNNSCDIIDPSIWDDIRTVLWIINIGGILLLIIMSALEFIKAITSSEEDKLKKSFKNTVIRAVACIILLILPMVITFVIDIINDNNVQTNADGSPLIGENGKPLCNID